ncbi:tRNA (cytidine(56)-2'-O)-methyltransferase [Candidatus Micrarchaeota archaeon]|jgi:tRNA (cytidine56-2'-O)-methyltransferase|nr:tRNA (cytidine(56)-2'-O)-methyltransferase [Candidatus Micrarchaeota archaeon]
MINILRLSHRAFRDARMSSHVCLTARAFGANKVYYTGQKDEKLENSLNKVVNDWGGNFEVEYIEKWSQVIKEHKNKGFEILHLTMYGINPESIVKDIKNKDLLIIVGGEKVESEIYQLADYNVSIGNQPHSEVAALAILIHIITEGKELTLEFLKAKKQIIPDNKRKLLNRK